MDLKFGIKAGLERSPATPGRGMETRAIAEAEGPAGGEKRIRSCYVTLRFSIFCISFIFKY
jgi:hypothetical protein